LDESGSVTPGIEGMRGGSEIAPAEVASKADKRAFENILGNREEKSGEGMSDFEQIVVLW